MAYGCVLYDLQGLEDFTTHYTRRIDEISKELPVLETFARIEQILQDAEAISDEWCSDEYIVTYEVDTEIRFCLDELVIE